MKTLTLTDTIRKAIVDGIDAGLTQTAAAQGVGVHRNTLNDWIAAGAGEQRRRADGATPNPAMDSRVRLVEGIAKAKKPHSEAMLTRAKEILDSPDTSAALRWQIIQYWLERWLDMPEADADGETDSRIDAIEAWIESQSGGKPNA